MMAPRGWVVLLVALAFLGIGAGRAGATTLVNDPARPFAAQDFARAQFWLSRSHVPTAPGTYLLSKGLPDDLAVTSATGAAGDHHVWLNTTGHDAREALMHEMGHEAQQYLYAPALLSEVQNIMGMGGQSWDGNGAAIGWTPMELGADAYAECSMHQTWPGKWWDRTSRTRAGVLHSDRDRTAYDFRAGPRNFRRICAAYRSVQAPAVVGVR